jgi:hypothetical protein
MRGDKMPKEKLKEPQAERLNLALTPGQTKKLNDYCLAVANRQGKMPYAIKTKIGRMAIDEWLEKHGKDYDVEF